MQGQLALQATVKMPMMMLGILGIDTWDRYLGSILGIEVFLQSEPVDGGQA
jgi:hypothetical protein